MARTRHGPDVNWDTCTCNATIVNTVLSSVVNGAVGQKVQQKSHILFMEAMSATSIAAADFLHESLVYNDAAPYQL